MDDARLLDLVGRIYDAAGAAAEWNQVGKSIAEAVGAKYAWLMTLDPSTPEACWLRGATGSDHFDYPLHEDPWYPTVVDRQAGDVVVGSDHLSSEDLLDSPFYDRMLREPNIRYACMVIVERTDENAHFLAFNRTPEAGDFGAGDRYLLSLLAPHVRRAYALHCRLHSPFAFPRRLDPGLEHSPTAVFLLDRFDRVRWINRAGERLLATGDGVGMAEGRLRLEDAEAQRRMAADLAATRIAEPLGNAAATPLIRRCRRKSGALPYVFSVVPQNESLSCMRFDCSAAACVLIDDLEVGGVPSTHSLGSVFGLTRSEAEIAKGICLGRTLQELASDRHVSIHTIRNQLKSALAKTGSRSQADLVRRTLALSRIAPR